MKKSILASKTTQLEKQSSTSNFDQVYQKIITPLFESITDSRESNLSYSLSDCLKSGFALYSLKSPSLLSFRKQSTAEDSNIKNIYNIENIPSDNGLRKVLDNVAPLDVRRGFNQLYNYIKSIKLLDDFTYWNNHLIASLDGVEHFCSKEVSCEKCLTRKYRNGTISNYHSMLSVALVHPDQKEVFVLDNEPIVKQDGANKNDCEINAGKRLIKHLKSLYSNELMVCVFDALYACAPIVNQLSAVENWKYVINIKEDGNKHLFKQFDKKNAEKEVTWYTIRRKGIKHEFGFINDLELNASSPDTKVNMVYYIERDKNGKEQIFSWITNIKITKENVFQIMKMGRSRWKIENETFNTLKNQGYHFSHNFGHGNNNLCTIFAYLMMLAFYVDQIQQHCCLYFKKILKELKTKSKLWESVRAVFKIIPCKKMEDILINVAEMYQIRLI